MLENTSAFGALKRQVEDLLLSSLPILESSLELDFIVNNIIDSAGFMDLFILLEDRFEIEIREADMKFENFNSVNNITSFIRSKKCQSTDEVHRPE